MSATFKIAGVTVAADPYVDSWQQVISPNYTGAGALVLSRYRRTILSFNALTSAQFNEWLTVCDDYTTHTIYLPRRVDAAYATGPELFDYGSGNMDTAYAFHSMGYTHSPKNNLYSFKVLVYMVQGWNIGGGGG